MKKIFTISAIVFSVLLIAQEAGKIGEFLKNEATKVEMQTQQKNNILTNKGRIPNNNAGFRNQNPKNLIPTYQWNQNRGYSEVFLRIPEYGYFTIEIGNQTISNDSGKYRFFDLKAGSNNISIYQNGYLVYRTLLNVKNNSRMILDFFTNKGLYLLDIYPIQNQTYGFNEWDDIWNNPYGNYNNNSYGSYGKVMNDRDFDQFINVLKKNTFEDRKKEIIKQQANTVFFTSQQIKTILISLSYESDRLEIAKLLYRNCVDKQNFFMVYDTFSFESSKKELANYVASGF